MTVNCLAMQYTIKSRGDNHCNDPKKWCQKVFWLLSQGAVRNKDLSQIHICHINLLEYKVCLFDFLLSLALWRDIIAFSVLLQLECINVLSMYDIWVNDDI